MKVPRSRSFRATLERQCCKNSTVLPIVMTLLFCARGNAAVLQPVVTLLFQFQREFLAALFDNPACRKHVYEVRRDVIDQTLLVPDQNQGFIWIVKFIVVFSPDSQLNKLQTEMCLLT